MNLSYQFRDQYLEVSDLINVAFFLMLRVGEYTQAYHEFDIFARNRAPSKNNIVGRQVFIMVI